MAAGINPYRYVPDDPHLAALRDPDNLPEINRGNYARTIYPPAAQAIFFRDADRREPDRDEARDGRVRGGRGRADAAPAAAAGKPASWIAVYAWNPLPLWEFAGSGHIDAAMIAFVALALWSRRPWLTGLALAGGTLVKLYPAALLPALWRRWDWRMPAVFCVALVAAYLLPRRLPGPARTFSASCRAIGRGRVCRRRRLLLVESGEIGPAARRRLDPALSRRRRCLLAALAVGSHSGGPVRAPILTARRCSPPPLPCC